MGNAIRTSHLAFLSTSDDVLLSDTFSEIVVEFQVVVIC